MRSILVPWLAALVVSTAAGEPPRGERPGLVVQEVTPGFAAAEAGLRAGDLLLRWHRAANPPANPQPAGGPLRHPFDLWVVEVEQAPRGEVRLFGRRDRGELTAILAPSAWRLTTRPPLAPGDLEIYAQAGELSASEEPGEASQGLELWGALAEDWRRERPAWASWLHFQMARLAHRHELSDGGDASFRRALEGARRAAWRAELHRRRGDDLLDRGQLDRSQARYEAAIELQEGEKLAAAASLDRLGRVAWWRGDLAAAKGFFQRSLALREKLAPGSLEVAQSLNGLGIVAWNRGDLAAAEDLYRESLAIREKLLPGSLDVAGSLNNLGILAESRGDLAAAEEYHRRSLAIKERLAPRSLEVAGSLNNLGLVASRRGDLAAAELYYRRALAIKEVLVPESLELAGSLSNLGALAARRGDPAAAEGYLRRSLAIQEKRAPGSLEVARSLANLGDLEVEQQDLESAEGYHRRAFAIFSKLSPESVHLAGSLFDLGALARRRGDLAAAARLLRRALEIESSLKPGSSEEAETLYELSKVHRALGDADERLALLRRALEALESQVSRLGGGGQSRGSFLARYGAVYRETVGLLVERGEVAEAFHVLERSRVRGLLALLAERALVFAELPEELRRERLEANAEHDRILRALGDWTALGDGGREEEKEELARQLEAARQRQAEVAEKIRLASPRLAALEYPEPLTVAATRELLDPGTLLLAYSLGEERSLLFLVGRKAEDCAVLPLHLSLSEARSLVERFRVRHRDSELGERLLGPAASSIARAERLVILPDGPLHYLPFAALTDPTSGAGSRYLVEAAPLSVVGSATLLAELRKERGAPSGEVVAVFADPRYPEASADERPREPVLRGAVREGFQLAQLPATRAEAIALERLYPRASRLYVGAEAKEEAVKAVAGEAGILHLACHALVDDRRPLSSALALSIPEDWVPGRDNGLLQAWEIFEQVRVDAELVTLSACETALGKESGGEGLLGLTRAFHFAGAPSVLASLWAVSDESTAVLMEGFYHHLRSGVNKDEALRRAQLELLSGPTDDGPGAERRQQDFSDPYYWAPFQLYGDWR